MRNANSNWAQSRKKFNIGKNLLRRVGAGVMLLAFIWGGVAAYFPKFQPAPNANAETLHAADPSTIPACAGNSECFAFTIDTRLTSTGATTGTATTFAIPTSSYYVNGASAKTYNWIINWGDNTGDQTASGSSSTSSAGISHTYTTARDYQITIRPAVSPATAGWMNAFGFYNDTSGANADVNKYMFYSIDTPLTNLMRTQGATSRFAYMFYGARNAIGIPDNLFANISTTGDTTFGGMFSQTFANFAYNSTTATIPAGLFDSIKTDQGTDFSGMFGSAFFCFAYNSTTATIPSGLFDSINTSQGTDFSYMFEYVFGYFAYNSTTATIPSGLFDKIDTSRGEGGAFLVMFNGAFYGFAHDSTTATIPSGLFDSINTSQGTAFSDMFSYTFIGFAVNSTVATIPADLFDKIDTSQVYVNPDRDPAWGGVINNMFSETFAGYFYSLETQTNIKSGYAARAATFIVDGEDIDTQTFANPYATKNISTDSAPSNYPNANPGDKIVPTYNSDERIITVPAGYESYTWYRTDGTSCAVANPTPDCGAQTAAMLVSFPDATEWTPETSTEKGNVSFYNERSTVNLSFSSNGGSAIPDQTINFGDLITEPTEPTRDGYTFDGWYSDKELTTPWDFETDIATGDTVLFAKWTKIPVEPETPEAEKPVTPPVVSPVTPGAPNTSWRNLRAKF